MPRKKQTTKRTKLAEKPKTLGPLTNNYTMNQWSNVVETEFKRKSWADWTQEQLSNNKLK